MVVTVWRVRSHEQILQHDGMGWWFACVSAWCGHLHYVSDHWPTPAQAGAQCIAHQKTHLRSEKAGRST